jgi:serine/threonine protein kinase
LTHGLLDRHLDVGALRSCSAMHADLAGEMRTSRGRAFVKGARLLPDQRGGGAEAWSLLNEAEVLSAVRPHAPELLWRFDAAGWRIVGFEYVNGRQADYTPGSPDLDLIAAAVQDLATRECPPSVKLRVEDRYRALDDRAEAFTGTGLVHCDVNPDNVLITGDGAVCIVDWAFVSRGASWLECTSTCSRPCWTRAGHAGTSEALPRGWSNTPGWSGHGARPECRRSKACRRAGCAMVSAVPRSTH